MLKSTKKAKKNLSKYELDKALKRGKYITATYVLNSPESITFMRDFANTKKSDLIDDDISVAEELIKLAKSLYDINWTRTSFLYKLPSDELYDRVLEKYKEYTGGDEPFQANIPTGMRSVKHDFPELVGTLDKAYEVRDVSDKMSVEKFLSRIMKDYGVAKLHLMISPKYDGSSISVTFNNNRDFSMSPKKATSRGDFQDNKGVDMTNLILDRKDPKVAMSLFDDKIGIQYEAMVTESGRLRLSEITGVKYSTRRAAIAAAIKRVVTDSTAEDIREKINECISLVPLNVDENSIVKSKLGWSDLMTNYIMDNAYYGDIIPSNQLIYGTLEELLEDIQTIVTEKSQERLTLPYNIDGLVISVVNESIRENLGRSNNKNRWQIAYKFNAMVQSTKVTGILTTQGNQGYMGHNITFDPIEFNGVVYDKAPVNNVTRFEKLDLRIGDQVLVSYNADVMGYIYKDDTCIPNKNGEKIELPNKCINCGTPLELHKDMLKCVNEECPGQAVGRILEMIRILDIDFFGEETAQGLVDIGITDPIDFIQMDRYTLSKVLKGKNLDKAYEQFSEKISAEIDYSKVIDMLRIPSLRTKTAKKIVDHIGIESVLAMMKEENIDQLKKKISGVPGVKKNSVIFAEGLIEKKDLFLKLIELLNVVDMKPKAYEKIVLISGFRSNDEFSKLCQRLNYDITTSGKYDILVVAPDMLAGSKAQKARKSGKPIYTISKFLEKYGNM